MSRYAHITEMAARVLAPPVIHTRCCVCKRWLYDTPCSPAMADEWSDGLCPGDGPCKQAILGRKL